MKGAALCARAGCEREIPAAWHKPGGASHRFCSWECQFNEAWEEADQDAALEGLIGEARARRRSDLYLSRTAPSEAGL